MITYTIQRGDTLTSIAKAHNTTVEKLAEINGITNPNKIKAGAILYVKTTEETDLKNKNPQELQNEIDSLKEQINQIQNAQNEHQNSGFSHLKAVKTAAVGDVKRVVSTVNNTVIEGAKQVKELTERADSVKVGAAIGTILFPGVGTLWGATIGWLKKTFSD